MDKVSYALGLGIGRQLQDLCGEDLNINDFTQAVRDLLTGNHLAIDEIEEYLEKNAARSGVTVLPSGLQYEVLREGTGRKPKATDSVKCHYEGTLVDGTVFDSSRRRGEPAVFPLNGVIRGWTEGLQLMQEGAVYRFFIPYNLAYGENGAGASIPPYAALVFEVELIEVI